MKVAAEIEVIHFYALYIFLIKQPTRCTNYPNLFCYKTLHVSGILSAHHQEFSAVHMALELSSILTLLGGGHQKPARNLPVPNVQQKTPDDGQRRCPKHAEFYNRINLDN